jgi:hypothetical protein
MSLLSRLFGKPAPASNPSQPPEPKKEPAPARPDPAEVARDEEAQLARAVAAGDRAGIGRWVLEAHSTRVRQAAARAIEDPDQIRDLLRASRGKDKHVHRILADKRDALLAEDRARKQRLADVESAAAAIARLPTQPVDATYAQALSRLEARWEALAGHAAPETRDEVARNLERSRTAVDEHRRAADAAQARARAAALAAEEERQCREQEAQAAAIAAAEAEREREEAQRAERARRETEAAKVRELVQLLRQAQAAVAHGGTARALRLRAGIEAAMPDAPVLPPWYGRQLEEVDARLGELQDWKTFTVVPKRAELLEQMQALTTAELSPEERARRIRHLRDDWRTVNRGAGPEAAADNEQFDALAERAYEPCREHFARQAEARKQNEVRREELLERLNGLIAEPVDERTDWRALQRALSDSRREWREHAPVDAAVIESLQARFRAATDELQQRLDGEYARNVAARRDLVDRAAVLVGLEDVRTAVDEAKALQRAWTTIGLVPRRDDEKLWTEFRRHCDAVFARIVQERAAHDAAIDAARTEAGAICDALERIAGLEGDELIAAEPEALELRRRFEMLDLPRPAARGLQQGFTRATRRLEEALRRHHAMAERRGWTDLYAASDRARQLELAILEGASAEELESLRSTAESAVAALGHAPKAGRAALEQRLARSARGELPDDLAANERALRLLCVRAELVAEVATPPEDLELRREYQMQRLMASMGQGRRESPAALEELALEWLAAGPVESPTYDALLGRLQRCLAT